MRRLALIVLAGSVVAACGYDEPSPEEVERSNRWAQESTDRTGDFAKFFEKVDADGVTWRCLYIFGGELGGGSMDCVQLHHDLDGREERR